MNHNQTEFTIVLPSNSSLKYFPQNTTTSFFTHLPKEIELNGRWRVGISEIHIPCTTLHISHKDSKISPPGEPSVHFQHGNYKTVKDLIQVIKECNSSYVSKRYNKHLFYDEKGGFVLIKSLKNIRNDSVRSQMSETLLRILGFENGPQLIDTPIEDQNEFREFYYSGKIPASLERAIPDQLFVYSSICEPCIVGDTFAPLLRIVNLEARKFDFGTTIAKKYNPIQYVPLLTNRFQSIEIDIRDQFGKPIPFEFGTVTVTLHFKREI